MLLVKMNFIPTISCTITGEITGPPRLAETRTALDLHKVFSRRQSCWYSLCTISIIVLWSAICYKRGSPLVLVPVRKGSDSRGLT